MVFKSEFKGAIMNRGLVKFISLFIFDKEKKQAFRIKYDAIERLRQRLSNERGRINALEYNLGMLAFKVLPHICVDYLHGLNTNQVSNLEEHKQNVEALKANLEEESLHNLNKILNIIEKLKFSKIFLPENFYTGEEFEAYKAHVDMEYEIEPHDGYWQYKKYKLPVNFFCKNVFVGKYGLHKLKTLAKMCKDSVIIDAGGCICDSALIFREFCPDNKIISFEPGKKNYEWGLKTIELNNLDNIIYENMALGAEKKILFMSENSYNIGAQAIIGDCASNQKHNGQACQAISLDEYVKEHNLKVGLIKTDLEGFEQQFLEGAINTIKEQKPILLISIYHNYHDFYKIKPWIESLNLGYKFDFFRGYYEHPYHETLLIGEVY